MLFFSVYKTGPFLIFSLVIRSIFPPSKMVISNTDNCLVHSRVNALIQKNLKKNRHNSTKRYSTRGNCSFVIQTGATG